MNKKLNLYIAIFMIFSMLTVNAVNACDVTAVTNPATGDYVSGSEIITWSFTGGDCGSTTIGAISYSTDGATWVTTGYPANTVIANVGQWTWTSTINVDDTSAQIRVNPNTGTFADSGIFTLDNTNPVADATNGAPYSCNEGSSVTFDASSSSDPSPASGIDTYEWDIDNDAVYDYNTTSATQAHTCARNDGSYTVGLRVTDNAGNQDTTTTTLTINNVAPTVSVDYANGGEYERGTFDINWTATDPYDTLLIDIDYSTNNGGAWTSLVVGTTNDGTHSWNTVGIDTTQALIRITANDDDTSPTDISDAIFTIDNTAPTGTVTRGTATIYDSDLVQEVTVTYDEAMENTVDPTITFGATTGTISTNGDGAWSTVTYTDDTWTETFDITDAGEETTGVTIASSGAEDIAGNTEGASVSVTFDIDTKNPTGTVVASVDPMYESALTQTVTITYDETMHPLSSPIITFDQGTFTSNGVGVWSVGTTVWTKSFTLTDNDEEIAVVTVTSSGATDLIGNPEDTSVSDTFEIDTLQPTITAFDDTDFLFVDRGNTVTVTITFSETMGTTIPTVLETGANAPGWTLNNIVWADTTHLSFDYAVPDSDFGLLADSSFTVTLAEDVAGNVIASHTESTVIDTDKPGKGVYRANDPMYEGSLTQTITLIYDESMDNTSTPIIVFDGGTFTSNGNGVWSTSTYTNDRWIESFTLVDNDEEIAVVNVTSSGATDISGNVELTSGQATFEIDTIKPIGTLSISRSTMYEGGLDQRITITYDESMDSSSSPTIDFDQGTFTSSIAGVWSTTTYTNDTWTETFNLTDNDEEIPVVTVTSSGATDVAGNLEDTSVADTFEIDTIKPTILSATASPDPTTNGTVTITVVFSENMNFGIGPVVQITGLTTDPYSVLKQTYVNDTWIGTFTLLDEDEESTATISVTGGPEDVAGNVMIDNATAGTFEVDTITPETDAVEVSPTPVRAGSQFTVTAVVIETNFDEATATIYNEADTAVATLYETTINSNNVVSFTFTDSDFTAGTFVPGNYRVVVVAEDTAFNLEVEDDNNRETFEIIEPLEGDPVITSFTISKTSGVEPGEILTATCVATFENDNNSYYEIDGIFDADGVMNFVAEMNDGTYTVTCKAVDGVNSRFVIAPAYYTVGAINDTGAELVTYFATYGTTSINNVKVALDWLYDNFDDYYTKVESDARYYTQTYLDAEFDDVNDRIDNNEDDIDDLYDITDEHQDDIWDLEDRMDDAEDDIDDLYDITDDHETRVLSLEGTDPLDYDSCSDVDTSCMNWTESDITDLDKYTQAEVDSEIDDLYDYVDDEVDDLYDYVDAEETARIADVNAEELARIDGDSDISGLRATSSGIKIQLTKGWTEFRLPAHILTGTNVGNYSGLNVTDYGVETVLDSINDSYDYVAYYDGTQWLVYEDDPTDTFLLFPTAANTPNYVFSIHMTETNTLEIAEK